jgi:hypothetical protein
MFFGVYANLYSLYFADKQPAQLGAAVATADSRALPFVADALASIAEGGYNEAFARAAVLLTRKDEALPLSRLVMRGELAKTYAGYLPDLPPDQWRRIRGEQEIIARYEPEQAIGTLPALLDSRTDRERLLTLLDKLMADQRVQMTQPTPEQLAMLDRIRTVLSSEPAHVPASLLAMQQAPAADRLPAKGK